MLLPEQALRAISGQALEGSRPLLVILRVAKDLCPGRSGYGLARCFAKLSMTILLKVPPTRSSCHPQTFIGPHQDSSVQNNARCRVEKPIFCMILGQGSHEEAVRIIRN